MAAEVLRGIAASRAGEAGKGFAVVASEVEQMAHDSRHLAAPRSR